MSIVSSPARATLAATFVLARSGLAGTIAAPGESTWVARRPLDGRPQQATFRASVEIVALDVNVVDSQGRPVEGLKPGDFTVTVDRKPRKIVSAQYVNHGVRLPAARGKSAAAGASALDALSAPPPSAVTERNVMIVVDTDSLEIGEGQAAMQAARAFITQLAPSDRIGVATIPRLPSTLTFSTDRAVIAKQLSQIITAPPDMPSGEQTVGLQEAYDIEHNDSSAIGVAVARECKCAYSGDSSAVSAASAASGAAVTEGQAPCTGTQIQMCVVPLLNFARQFAMAGHMQAQRSLDALRDLADGLKQIPGPKTVVLVSGGLGIPETSTSFDPLEPALANGQVTLYTLYMERMSLGQVRRPLSPTFALDDRIGSIGIENVTAAAGGTLVRVVGRVESSFEQIAREMSGSYLLGIEVEPGDRDGKSHAVDVKVNRSGVEVRSRRRYVIEPETAATKRATAAAATAPPSTAARAARRAERAAPIVPELESVTPELMALLGRAGNFVLDYQERIAALAAEEEIDQTLSRWQTGPVVVNGVAQKREDWFIDKRRRMKAEYVLVKGAGPTGWQHFRDVFEVDGTGVRPRSGRLAQLFAQASPSAVQQASQIMTDSARQNLGVGERNMDVPTLALVLLDPAVRSRFFFRKEAEQQVAGITVWQVVYTERGSPTIFAGDLPLQGTLWIEPDQGRVVRSTLRLNMEETDAEITVTYAPAPELGGLWAPNEVRESYTSDTQKLEVVAKYTNFRLIGK